MAYHPPPAHPLLFDLHHGPNLLVVEVEVVGFLGVPLHPRDQVRLLRAADLDAAGAANDLGLPPRRGGAMDRGLAADHAEMQIHAHEQTVAAGLRRGGPTSPSARLRR